MQERTRTIATRLLIASTLLSPLSLSSAMVAQDRQRRAVDETGQPKTWPSEQPSIVKKASESKEPAQLSNEPVMRIALSTDSRVATISTTGRLLNASEMSSETLPLDAFGHTGFTGTSCWIDGTSQRVYILLTNRTHARALPFANINQVRREFHTLAAAALAAR